MNKWWTIVILCITISATGCIGEESQNNLDDENSGVMPMIQTDTMYYFGLDIVLTNQSMIKYFVDNIDYLNYNYSEGPSDWASVRSNTLYRIKYVRDTSKMNLINGYRATDTTAVKLIVEQMDTLRRLTTNMFRIPEDQISDSLIYASSAENSERLVELTFGLDYYYATYNSKIIPVQGTQLYNDYYVLRTFIMSLFSGN